LRFSYSRIITSTIYEPVLFLFFQFVDPSDEGVTLAGSTENKTVDEAVNENEDSSVAKNEDESTA
jgi:hypothetical protein